MITVPSNGLYYEGGKSNFMVKYLTYKEEVILANERIMDTEEGIKIVLQNVIMDDFNIENLLVGDVQAISLFLYSTSFGDKIEMDISCPVCNWKEKKEIKISQFQPKEIHDVPTNNDRILSTVLPISKKNIKIKIPTFFEEFRFRKETDDAASHIQKMIFVVEEFDGIVDKEEIVGNILRLQIKDSRYLKNFIDVNTPGVDSRVKHKCVNCKNEFDVRAATGYSFLKLPESYSNTLLEELFLCTEHGENITWEDAKQMSTSTRKWLLKRIEQEINKKNKAQEEQANRAKSRVKTARR